MSWHSKDFWEARYAKDQDLYDFYHDIDSTTLEGLLKCVFAENARILHCGSGTSGIPEMMSRNWGFKGAEHTGVDFAPSATKAMKEDKFGKKQVCEWITADVRDLSKTSLKENSFEAVFDKGCLDCILSGPDGYEEATRYLLEVDRYLRKKDGTWLIISTCNPDLVKDLFEQSRFYRTWTFSSKPFPAQKGPNGSGSGADMNSFIIKRK